MPCLRCGVEFGLFKRESYCRQCGFAFCSNCLSKKMIIPKLGTDSKHSVCNKCFGLLKSGQTEINANMKASSSPPAALQKRMELLANQQGMNCSSNGIPKGDLDNPDKAIAERLDKLRERNNSDPVPSTYHLEERLSRLKGTPRESSSCQKKPMYYKPDTRTELERTQDLLHQVVAEIELESKYPSPEEEIRIRLAKLRNEDPTLNDLNKPPGNGLLQASSRVVSSSSLEHDGSNSNPEILDVWQHLVEAEKEVCKEAEEALQLQEKDTELKRKLDEIRANRDTEKRRHSSKTSNGDLSDEDNEDKLTDKLIHQFLSESKLDGALGSVSNDRIGKRISSRRDEKKVLNLSDTEAVSDLEELPWCTICNADASLRCYGCDGDLYCRKCFRECHNSHELREHPSSPFTA